MSLKKHKAKSSLSKLEQERQARIELGKLKEELEATGQESDTKAAKYVIEKENENLKTEADIFSIVRWKLEDSKLKPFTYMEILEGEWRRQMGSYDLPRGWMWSIQRTKKGIALFIRDRIGKFYGRGIKVCFEPKYDLNAMDRLIVKALNFIEGIDDSDTLRKTPGGILY